MVKTNKTNNTHNANKTNKTNGTNSTNETNRAIRTDKINKTKEGDFIEIEFVARVKDGSVFDTTIDEEAKKAGLLDETNKESFKPFRLCVGKEMILHGLDAKLEDKELGKEYEIELKPEEAFGKRNPKLIKIFSSGSFVKKGMAPQPGAFVNINNMVAKIMSVSGGRVAVDFNNPLADKIIIYKVKINRIIEDEKEKIDALANFYFKDYEIKEKGEEKDKNFELIVKGKKVEVIDKDIKGVFPRLVVTYS